MRLLAPLAVPCYARVPRSASAHRGTDRPPVDGLRPCTPFTKQPTGPLHTSTTAPRRTLPEERDAPEPSPRRNLTNAHPPPRPHQPEHTSPHQPPPAPQARQSTHHPAQRDEPRRERDDNTPSRTSPPSHAHTHTSHAHNKTNYEKNPHNGTPPQRTANEKNPHRHTASGASGLLYAPTAAPVRAVAPEDVLTHSGTRDARHTSRSRRP